MLCLNLVCWFFTSACLKLTHRSHWIKFICLILVILSNRILSREEKEQNTDSQHQFNHILHWCASSVFLIFEEKQQKGSKQGRRREEVGGDEREDTLELQHAFRMSCRFKAAKEERTAPPYSASWQWFLAPSFLEHTRAHCLQEWNHLLCISPAFSI